MTTRQERSDPEHAADVASKPKAMGRRGALRALGAAAAAAAGAAALTAGRPERVRADGTEGSTTFTGPISATSSASTPAVEGDDSSAAGYGVVGRNTGGGTAVFGAANSTSGLSGGVQGVNAGSDAAVLGNANGSGPAVVGLAGSLSTQAVPGEAAGAGVYGATNSGTSSIGVFGRSTNGNGVQGDTSSTFAAVLGLNTGTGAGVIGRAGGYATAPLPSLPSLGAGVFGATDTSGAAGVEGQTDAAAAYGAVGRNTGGGTGVFGAANSTSGLSGGVQGANAGSDAGVLGNANGSGPGVAGLAGTSSSQALSSAASGAGVFGNGGGAGRGGVFEGQVAAIRLVPLPSTAPSGHPTAGTPEVGDLAVGKGGDLWFYGGSGPAWHRVTLAP